MNQNNNHRPQSFPVFPFYQKQLDNSQALNQKPFTIIQKSKHHQKVKTQKSLSAVWSNLQKQKYSIFICYFRQILSQSPSNYNQWNMFKAMSKFIESRNPQQCRSYHLKLLKEFHTVGKFIEVVVKRLPSLKQKIFTAEDQLNRLQLEFDLFIEQQQKCPNFINSNVNEKQQCKELPKTSDTYIEEPNPVGQFYHSLNYNAFQNFNDKPSFDSSFKSYGFKQVGKASMPSFAQKGPSNFLTSNKASLPSFAEQEEQQQDNKVIKVQSKQDKLGFSYFQQRNFKNDWNYPIQGKYDNFNIDFKEKMNKQQDNEAHPTGYKQKYQKDRFLNEQSQKGLQKMKEILQCHYLFQLWTSKLQKIMRQ